MLLRRVTLFHFFGFEVKADTSWIFLSILISWTLSNNLYPAAYPGLTPNTYHLMGATALFGIIFSILMHEVAHALIAEYYRMKIESITLFIFGGVAEMKGEPVHPRGEFFMAIAGPVMSAGLGLFFLTSEKMYVEYFGGAGPVSYVLKSLGNLNFVLAAFNMIPAFPLDGGRALRAVIWDAKDNLVLATRISSETGKIFASLLFAYAFYEMYFNADLLAAVWSALLGFFVSGSASYALRQTESRSLLSHEALNRFVDTQTVTVSPDMTITELVDNYVCKHYQRFFPVVDRGQLVGLLPLRAVLSLDRHKWQWLHIASVMEPVTSQNTIEPEYNAADALELLQTHGREALLVAGKDRKFQGVIHLQDLLNYLAITMRVDHNKAVTTSRTALD